MDTLLIPLIRSPKLPQYVSELTQLLADEAVARQKFRDWVTPGMKAEFINGEVIVHSPAKFQHNNVRSLIERLLSLHVDARNLGKVQSEKAMVELTRNDYEPDVCFWGNKKSFAFEPDQMLFPPPDLVVEVLSPSTQDVDRGAKFDDYASNDIQEYWIVSPIEREVEQFLLHNGVYRLKVKAGTFDVIRSAVVDGFDVPVAAFFDVPANLQAVADLLR